jgi:protein-S-isoprenylcysteine O-methyltransferase Ste14
MYVFSMVKINNGGDESPDMAEVKVPPSYLKWMVRGLILLLFLVPLLFPLQFLEHFRAHFTGAIEGSVITGQWYIVLINVLLFVSFLIPLSFRKKVSWKEYGLVAAFFISLFIEMYGIPLTIMFFSRAFHPAPTDNLEVLFTVDLLGQGFGFTHAMAYGSLLMMIGTIIVIVGWVTLYRNIDRDGLVTTGIYSVSRHPQYLGFLIVILGWVIGWTTVLTVIFGIVLFIMYLRVCLKEEREMGEDHDYSSYREKVPFMI